MPNTRTTSEHSGDLAFVRRVFIVVAIGALIAAIWALSDILLLLFGSILFAVMLHAVAAPLETHLRLGRRPALALGGALMVLILAAAGIFLGPELVTQMRNLFTTLPEATNRVMGYFQLGSMADLIKDGTTASALGGLASRIIAWSTTIAGALASLLAGAVRRHLSRHRARASIATASSSWCRRPCSPTSTRRSTTAGRHSSAGWPVR